MNRATKAQNDFMPKAAQPICQDLLELAYAIKSKNSRKVSALAVGISEKIYVLNSKRISAFSLIVTLSRFSDVDYDKLDKVYKKLLNDQYLANYHDFSRKHLLVLDGCEQLSELNEYMLVSPDQRNLENIRFQLQSLVVDISNFSCFFEEPGFKTIMQELDVIAYQKALAEMQEALNILASIDPQERVEKLYILVNNVLNKMKRVFEACSIIFELHRIGNP